MCRRSLFAKRGYERSVKAMDGKRYLSHNIESGFAVRLHFILFFIMNNKINKKRIFLIAVSYLLSFIYFMVVNPEKLTIIFILVPFIIIFINLYLTINLLLEIFLNISKTQRRIITLVSSLMPTLLLTIQSITQLTIRDIVLSLMIMGLIVWYSLRLN